MIDNRTWAKKMKKNIYKECKGSQLHKELWPESQVSWDTVLVIDGCVTNIPKPEQLKQCTEITSPVAMAQGVIT